MLRGKRIIVGVTGSIAAYKAAILVRLLVKAGAEVRVIMTPLAKEFITPLTLATVSKHPILVEFFDPENGAWNSHVSLGEWADAYLIAPATANTMAKMANGVADNLLLTTYLSARCPVFVAPAMDLDMFTHEATTRNIRTLQEYGNHIIEPASGELASGLEGKGRMEEPERIVAYLEEYFNQEQKLTGRKFMVTAGPTVEPLDAVRYISNYSSGKMGYAIADELLKRGAEVTLVTGRTNLACPVGAKVVPVVTAEEMYQAALQEFALVDGAVMTAAVADYTPARPVKHKMKKSEGALHVELKPTTDIAAELGRQKGNKLLVGFALETDNELQNALRKMEAKNLDFVVLNSLSEDGAGFTVDTNRVTILGRNGNQREYPLKSKTEVAVDIVNEIEKYLK